MNLNIEYATECPPIVDFIEQCYYKTTKTVTFYYWVRSVPKMSMIDTVAIWRIKNIKGSNLSTGLAIPGKP
jgi:hypothetical protein